MLKDKPQKRRLVTEAEITMFKGNQIVKKNYIIKRNLKKQH